MMTTLLRQPVVVFAAAAISLVALFADLFTTAEYCPPILYVIALTLGVQLRDRRIVWSFAAAMVALTFAGGFYCYPPQNPDAPTTEFWINRALVAVALIGIALLLDGYVRLAEAYRHRSEELALANADVEVARKRAEEASARKTRFMAAVSHDIRTPATAIRVLARVIREVRADPARVEDLTLRLESSAAALTELLTDALDVARFDSDTLMDLHESDIVLAAVLDHAVGVVRPLAEAKRLQLAVDDAAAGALLHTDRVRLTRVIVNLLDNAIKFTDAGVVAVDTATETDGGVRIVVRDTGRGIAAADLPHVFEEFFQARGAAPERTTGRGLGLATCKRLIEAMEGRIDVQSRAGVGTVVRIVFPASRVRFAASAPQADRPGTPHVAP
jgi:signal transduction histidine kinase